MAGRQLPGRFGTRWEAEAFAAFLVKWWPTLAEYDLPSCVLPDGDGFVVARPTVEKSLTLSFTGLHAALDQFRWTLEAVRAQFLKEGFPWPTSTTPRGSTTG